MRNKINFKNGFTLIEVLVSLTVFAIAMLGIALHTTQGIQASNQTEIHASAMQIAKQITEPLTQALRISKTQFQLNLQNLNNIDTPMSIYKQANPVASGFHLDINAIDNQQQSLLNTDPSLWQAPYTIVINLSYQDSMIDSPSFQTTHVLVPAK